MRVGPPRFRRGYGTVAIDTRAAMKLPGGMDSTPLEALFAAAIVLVVLMGAVAILFLLRRASGVIANAKDKQAEAMNQVEKAAALQREAIDVTREGIALQRETNRLLAELLARTAGPGSP